MGILRSSSNFLTLPPISLVSKSVRISDGCCPHWVRNRFMAVESDSFRLVSPYTSFCLVSLLTARRVYFIPPIAVHGPKPISIFHTVDDCAPTGKVFLLRLLECIVDTSPGSSFGLRGNRWMEKLLLPSLDRYFWRLVVFRKPIDRSRSA